MTAREKHTRARLCRASAGGKIRAVYLDRDTEIKLRALVRFYGGSVSSLVATAIARLHADTPTAP